MTTYPGFWRGLWNLVRHFTHLWKVKDDGSEYCLSCDKQLTRPRALR
jgi:hypothetical protein